MDDSVSAVWRFPSHTIRGRLTACVESACADAASPVYVFFRSDDVAVPGKALTRLMDLFVSVEIPLSLAVVPAWLTRTRWTSLLKLSAKAPTLWCWHQHGWIHKNHEASGKKQEFGPSRSTDSIHKDILKGRHRLEKLMGKSFHPIFTPPWNRCSMAALDALRQLNFQAVSRFNNSQPSSPAGLPDIPATVDLHTRKSVHPAEDMACLLTELFESISTGFCGIMVHHRCMNDAAFYFLKLLLDICRKTPGIIPTGLQDLVEMFSAGVIDLKGDHPVANGTRTYARPRIAF